jgi:hypothetical protein
LAEPDCSYKKIEPTFSKSTDEQFVHFNVRAQAMQSLRHFQLLKRVALFVLVSFFGSGVFVCASVYSAVLAPSSLANPIVVDLLSVLIAAALTSLLFSHALVALAGRYAYLSCLVIPGGFILFMRWFELRSWFMCVALVLAMLVGIWLLRQRSNIAVERDAPQAARPTPSKLDGT